MRGRQQKTPKQKALSGKAPNVPKAEPLQVKECPEWMPATGRELWEELSVRLSESGVITVLDESALEALCLSYALMRQAAAEMLKEGFTVTGDKGTIKKHPAFSIYKSNADTYRRFAEQFGLSPLARQRLDLPEPPKKSRWGEAIAG